LVRGSLPDAARDRVPRSQILLPSLFETRRQAGGRDGDIDLGAHQPDQPARKYPADAPARAPDPQERGESAVAESGAEEAVASSRGATNGSGPLGPAR